MIKRFQICKMSRRKMSTEREGRGKWKRFWYESTIAKSPRCFMAEAETGPRNARALPAVSSSGPTFPDYIPSELRRRAMFSRQLSVPQP